MKSCSGLETNLCEVLSKHSFSRSSTSVLLPDMVDDVDWFIGTRSIGPSGLSVGKDFLFVAASAAGPNVSASNCLSASLMTREGFVMVLVFLRSVAADGF